MSCDRGPELIGLPSPLGVGPTRIPADERYALTVGETSISVQAAEPVGAARGLSSLLQLMATASRDGHGAVTLSPIRILDAPRFAWRGLTVDVARRFFGAAQVRKLIDLMSLYKLNVLHLHLTDDQGWRIEAGRPANAREPDGTFYREDELRALVAYAADRFITVLPEVDTPGHAAALLRLRPELASGRNLGSYEPVSGQAQPTAWLDPELPVTATVTDAVFAELAGIFPGPFIHIGGDEPFGMPGEAYAAYVNRLKLAVRGLGRRTVGWQESIRAGADPEHVIQHWMSPGSPGPDGNALLLPGTATVNAGVTGPGADVELALARGVPVIVSPQGNCYFDVPYADTCADPAQEERRRRVGMRSYAPKTVAATFDWEPVAALGPGADPAAVAGVGAAVWCETVRDFDDLTFLLLPRLAGMAEKAWGGANAISWEQHRRALSTHQRLWAQDGLSYFQARASGP